MEPGAHPPRAACRDDVHAACGYALCRAFLEEGIAEGRAACARCGGECTVSNPVPWRSSFPSPRSAAPSAPCPRPPPAVEETRPLLEMAAVVVNYPLDAGVLAFVVAKSAKFFTTWSRENQISPTNAQDTTGHQNSSLVQLNIPLPLICGPQAVSWQSFFLDRVGNAML
ncbi:hypothetical protein ZWY2020_049274 [Hordeum vulgare]|nr:hypothetical protein ZWY2020_049274 [Hordeum vulgare]